VIELPLRGPGGEPVDLWRTIASHGCAELAPHRVDEAARTLRVTLALPGRRPRTIVLGPGPAGAALVAPLGRPPGEREERELAAAARRLLRLDEDLSPLYELLAGDPDLAWATAGAGRLLRSATVFEDVVKTLCTTNCAWSATVRMTDALVAHLGERGPHGSAFPTPAAMAEAPEAFYREVARAGYRGAYLRALAAEVAESRVDLEALARDGDLRDDEVERRLLALPGVGPYAAAHAMLLLGRYSRLVLDSWTRPTYARLAGARRPLADARIVRRFRRYGRFAGLAFWLFLTRDWVAED